MGSLLDDAKSETWFLDALNGSGMLLPRNLSDSATMDTCLVNLGSDFDVDLEATSHRGKMAVEEQLAQMSFVQVIHGQQVTGGGRSGESSSSSRILSEDERSDQGVPVSFRKPPLSLQPVQNKAAGAFYNLPSPDSVASDTSIASPGSLSKPMHYQDQSQVANRPPLSPDTKIDPPVIRTSHFQNQQVQDQNFHIQPHSDQQQQQQQQHYLATGTQLLSRPPANQMTMPSYYTVYASPQQQQHHYPVYVMPMQHTHPYMSVQSNVVDLGATPSNQSVYKEIQQQQQQQPIYPSRAAATSAKADQVPQTMYATAITSAPSLIQVPSSQFQNQYAGYSQVQNPNQPIAAAAAAANNYAYDYNSNVAHDHQVYCTLPDTRPWPRPLIRRISSNHRATSRRN